MNVIDKVIAWLQAEIDKLKRLKKTQDPDDRTSEIEIVQTLYVKLRADYDNLVNNYTSLQDNHMLVTKQLSRLRVGIENFKDLNSGLRKASETKRMTIDRLQQELRFAQSQYDSCMARLQSEIDSAKSENAMLQQKLIEREAYIAQLQIHCHDTEHQTPTDQDDVAAVQPKPPEVTEPARDRIKGKFDPLWYDEYHRRNKGRTPKDKDYLSLRAFAREKGVDSHTIRRGFKRVEHDRRLDI
ncbi:MAG: hypothetical protein HQL05_12285 [Nitrospirae bacterium]|uniref:hypothetical protein n=1 Tax=Candidatus Magnetobacterium casense TaxID=1455061 RepID=UPI00058D5660|nr:hypothetical protein [Candidatus Magnetobacterium casensis]MBF0338594.1 hypothetical protein [Nitrospirota bacterium]